MKKKIKINQGLMTAVLLVICVTVFAACQQMGTGAAASENGTSSHESSYQSKIDSSASETSKPASAPKAMTYNELKEWSDEKLAQEEKDVQKGINSEENLKKERAFYEKALSDLENGAEVYLQEREDGAYSLNTVYPHDEVLTEIDENGNMIYKDK